jgi:hypothetical protein
MLGLNRAACLQRAVREIRKFLQPYSNNRTKGGVTCVSLILAGDHIRNGQPCFCTFQRFEVAQCTVKSKKEITGELLGVHFL